MGKRVGMEVSIAAAEAVKQAVPGEGGPGGGPEDAAEGVPAHAAGPCRG